jgi:hypothetical protein
MSQKGGSTTNSPKGQKEEKEMTRIEFRRHLDIMNVEYEARNKMEHQQLTTNYTVADLTDMVAYFYATNCRPMVELAWETSTHRITNTTISVKGMILTLKNEQPIHPRIKLPKEGIFGTVGHSKIGVPALITIVEDEKRGRIITTLSVMDFHFTEAKLELPPFTPFVRDMGEPHLSKPVSKKRRKRDAQQKAA